MKAAVITVFVLGALAVAGAGEYYTVYNRLVAQRTAINAQWANIDVALQRRADLIPDLAESVKGFTPHESAVFQNIADSRAALMSGRTPQEKLDANRELTGALSRLLVIAENYPQLRSDGNYQRLQDEIAGAENQIAVERRKYNELLERYNASIQQFPANLVASTSGLTRDEAYFKTEPGARTVPKVQF